MSSNNNQQQDHQRAGVPGCDAAIPSVIRTWECTHGCDQELTDEQRKPWNLRLTMEGDELWVALWPAGQTEAEATEGLGLLIGLSKGVPSVHISPTPHGENAVHVHTFKGSVVEVMPENEDYVVGSVSRQYGAAPLVLAVGTEADADAG